MSQVESNISRRILAKLREAGYFAFKVHGSEFMMAGLPDIIVCAEGYFIGLETKRPTEREDLSPRQVYVHSLIKASKGRVEVVCSPNEALVKVRAILAS